MISGQPAVNKQMLLIMVKAFMLLWVTTNSHSLSISEDTPELIKENEKQHTKLLQPFTAHTSFFPSFFSFYPQEATHFLMPLQENHGRIILRQGMSCWTPAQATFSTVSERIQGYLLTSPLPLLPHFSSVSLCPTSCVSSGITFPLSTPQLSGFTTT